MQISVLFIFESESIVILKLITTLKSSAYGKKTGEENPTLDKPADDEVIRNVDF